MVLALEAPKLIIEQTGIPGIVQIINPAAVDIGNNILQWLTA